jgi:hypothetical protein
MVSERTPGCQKNAVTSVVIKTQTAFQLQTWLMNASNTTTGTKSQGHLHQMEQAAKHA